MIYIFIYSLITSTNYSLIHSTQPNPTQPNPTQFHIQAKSRISLPCLANYFSQSLKFNAFGLLFQLSFLIRYLFCSFSHSHTQLISSIFLLSYPVCCVWFDLGFGCGVLEFGNLGFLLGRIRKMGLLSGVMLGIVFGIAIMAGWHRMMQHRSTKRVAKAADLKVLASLGREELRKICGENFPEWISFPVFEQVKWLNKELTKLWPFVADAAELVIRETVEPLLEDYRPSGITSLKFSKLTLGTVPPKIEGIRVQSLKEGQIIMDIDLRWGGDPNIVLAVQAAHVASIPIQLKDLQVFTVVRVIFQLAEEIPCISAVVVALLSDPKPRIEYTLKAVGGSLTAFPGISDLIEDTVESIVTDTLQWPHRIVVPIGGPVDTSELELKPQGQLTVTVVKATGLKNMELIGKSDPYVILHIRPLFKVKTKVVDNNLNPVWNEKFELIAEDKETQSLIIEVFDKDNIGQDEKLGVTKVHLIDLECEVEQELELRLMPSHDMTKIKDKKDRGTITLKVLYHEFSKEEQEAALEAEKRIAEEKKKMKEAGLIGSTVDALDGAVSLVGTGIGAGVGLVGTGIGAGVGLVGTGVGAGVGIVGSGLGAVGSGLSKAGRFMGRTITGSHSHSRKSGSSTPVEPAPASENGANGGVKQS